MLLAAGKEDGGDSPPSYRTVFFKEAEGVSPPPEYCKAAVMGGQLSKQFFWKEEFVKDLLW